MTDKGPETKPRAYAVTSGKRARAPNKRRAAVALGNAERRLADPSPEPQTPDLTGRFEDTAGPIMMQINQAGSHLECWLVDYRTKILRSSKASGRATSCSRCTAATRRPKSGASSSWPRPRPC